MARLKREKSKMMDIVLKNPNCRWRKKTKEVMEKYNICEWELAEEKPTTKEIIEDRTREVFHDKMNHTEEGMSKTIHFLNGKGKWKSEETAE